jgi:hypothetical protein
MANATFTYTANMAVEANTNHAGVQALCWDFNSGASDCGSSGDAVLLGKLPAHCTVVGGHFYGGSPADAIHGLLYAMRPDDFSKSGGTIYGSFTISATVQRFDIRGPVRISLSADCTAAHAVVYWDVTTGASGTGSTSLHGVIYYVNDGRNAGG